MVCAGLLQHVVNPFIAGMQTAHGHFLLPPTRGSMTNVPGLGNNYYHHQGEYDIVAGQDHNYYHHPGGLWQCDWLGRTIITITTREIMTVWLDRTIITITTRGIMTVWLDSTITTVTTRGIMTVWPGQGYKVKSQTCSRHLVQSLLLRLIVNIDIHNLYFLLKDEILS